MASFDPQDKTSWFFGPMTRDEANKVFTNITEDGIFLVRESKTHRDDFVLCVKEGPKISHYIVNKVTHDNGYIYKIGEHTFPDIPAMLSFYQTHYLDKTPLVRPAPRETVRAKYDFAGQDTDDLPFRRGEVLEVIMKHEERWWTARNESGQIGQIPVVYITECDNQNNNINSHTAPVPAQRTSTSVPTPPRRPSLDQVNQSNMETSHVNKRLPAQARVIRNRIPNMFADNQLKLNEGEMVTVTEINLSGKWYGQIGDRQGYFPYTHIKFLDDTE